MEEHGEPFILTSVQVACWRLEGLPHAVHLIQQFIDVISQEALLNVLRKGKIHLFSRVLHAVDESFNMVYEEKRRQYQFAMRLVTENLTVNQGELDAMKDLYERYPGALDYDVMYTVTGFVELPVMKWLYKSKPILFKQFKFCDERLFINASLKGANNVVHWIVKLFPDTVRSLVYAARGGHLKLLKWTTKHIKWDENLVAKGLCEASKAGHLDTAKFLHEMNPPKIKLWNVEMESLEMLRWIHDINRWDFKSKVGERRRSEWTSRNVAEVAYSPHRTLLNKHD